MRWRLALSYALFLEAAGGITLLGIYIFLRYAPAYPLIQGDALDLGRLVGSRPMILQTVVGASITILIVLALMGITGGWILAGWVLRPLQRIHDGARIVATGRLDYRINLTNRNDEFRDLADTFDAMLDRLQDAFAVQERFAANASHELRTPLSVMQTMIDVARRDPEGQDYPQLVHRLGITNARAIGLTESLLRLADANAITVTAEPVDLATVVEEVLDECADEAARHTLSITKRLDPAPVVGDRDLLTQLVFNLVQNAIRHNVPSGKIDIATWHDPATRTSILQIENTSLPISPELAARLTEPFLRGAGRIERSKREQRGYGLGLALVDRITEVHHGTLTIVPGPTNGLVLTVQFPVRR
jgi:two-component system sensor histidine kinase VanS